MMHGKKATESWAETAELIDDEAHLHRAKSLLVLWLLELADNQGLTRQARELVDEAVADSKR